ncbi:MAG TPA: hypothetical protein PLD77_00630 [Candidatus Dojkabacteria bacterium]|nr:hypothetical protein [Candidatus Dojkabacteria bacterium]
MKDASLSISNKVHADRRVLLSEKNKDTIDVEKIFNLVLGREPTQHEKAYYKINRISPDYIAETLIVGEEHAGLVKDGHMYHKLKKEVESLKGTILRLHSDVEDKSKELAELTKLLNEKNKVIAELRKSNKAPYVSEKITNSSRVISCNEEKKKPTKDDYSFWDRILTIFFDKR